MKTRVTTTLEFVRAHGFESAEVLRPSRRCELARIASIFGATIETIVIGSSYVQRLTKVDTRLREALQACIDKNSVRVSLSSLHTDTEVRLFVTVYVHCIAIATKVWGERYSNFASAVLGHLDIKVPEDVSFDLEMECLRRLKWRLVPIERAVALAGVTETKVVAANAATEAAAGAAPKAAEAEV